MENNENLERARTPLLDMAACIVSGGESMRTRVEHAMSFYAPSDGYFTPLLAKGGRAFERSTSGFLLLDGLLQKNRINRAELTLTRLENGRPCFVGCDTLDFSISHSGSCAMCALAMGENASVGADLQREKRYSDDKLSELAMAFMDEEDMAAFYYAKDKPREFCTAWTHLEAYLKRTGESVFTDLRQVNLHGEFFSDGVIIMDGTRYFYSINTVQYGEAPADGEE